MNYKFFTLSLLAIVLVVACNDKPEAEKDNGRTLGKLNISKKYPQPGDTLQLSYDGTLTSESYFLYQVGKNTYAADFKFDKGKNPTLLSVEIPDSAEALLFNFKNDGQLDHNQHKGYSTLLYNDDKKTVKNSRIAKSYLYTNYGEQFEAKANNDSLIAWMEKDFQANSTAEHKWGNLYYQSLNKKNPEEAQKYAKERIALYEKKEAQDEEQLSNLISFYSLLEENEKADELKQKARSKYPKGEIAKVSYLEEFQKTDDPRKKEEIYKDFNRRFTTGNYKNEKSYMISQIANNYATKEEWEMFMKIGDEIPDPLRKASLFNSIAWDMAEKDKDLNTASKLSKNSLELVEKEMNNFSEKPKAMPIKNYKDMLVYNQQMYADTYGFILYKQGNLKEAISYQEKAVGEGENPEISERYLMFLMEAENYKEVEKNASKYISQNASTAKINEYFKTAYQKNNPKASENSFMNELQKLEKKGTEILINELKREKINEPAPDFMLTDAKGDRIKLSKLKGKTVILDFWATWCGPCIASFPGMKMAVEEYEKNENVMILFVNTFESGTMEERVKKSNDFMTTNNYPFQVLFDTKEENSNEFVVAKQFGITGIPTKIIIGPEGNINFKKVGYGGSNDKMLKEIELMAEMSQMK